MSNNYLDDDESIALKIVGVIIVLVLAGVVGLALGRGGAAKPAAPGASAPVLAIADDNVLLRIDAQMDRVNFYFGTGQAQLPATMQAEVDAALAAIVADVQGGKTAVLSGFHDATGDPALNAELAKQRAFSVRDALLRLGVPPGQIVLEKPAISTGSGSNAQARRVEVTLR